MFADGFYIKQIDLWKMCEEIFRKDRRQNDKKIFFREKLVSFWLKNAKISVAF